jgi:hypothetical protein
MSEVVDDVVVVDTGRGRVEARRMGRAEVGPSRWRVAYPWGAETFFGTSAELAERARTRVGDEAADTNRFGRA